MRPADYLSFYAEHFPAVEVDSTFYACPSVQTVSNWAARTPEGFAFAVKIPQSISHEKVLVGCDAELAEFLRTMDALGAKLGPIVFQFPFFNKSAFQGRHEFWTGLFRSSQSSRIRTNSRLRFAIETGWTPNLRACSVSATLPSCSRIVPGCQVLPNLSSIYAFANNHFSGHGPATIKQFRSIWQSKGFPPLDAPGPQHRSQQHTRGSPESR